jgi:hypothetical protein
MIEAKKVLALASALSLSGLNQVKAIEVSSTPPANTSAPLLEGFVSFSIEFAFFPDYAGIYMASPPFPGISPSSPSNCYQEILLHPTHSQTIY